MSSPRQNFSVASAFRALPTTISLKRAVVPSSRLIWKFSPRPQWLKSVGSSVYHPTKTSTRRRKPRRSEADKSGRRGNYRQRGREARTRRKIAFTWTPLTISVMREGRGSSVGRWLGFTEFLANQATSTGTRSSRRSSRLPSSWKLSVRTYPRESGLLCPPTWLRPPDERSCRGNRNKRPLALG